MTPRHWSTTDKDHAAEKLGDFLRTLPPGQECKVTPHDPPRDGWIWFTAQLVGPPAMVDGRFVGWTAMRGKRGPLALPS
jgi:hypothetical protein